MKGKKVYFLVAAVAVAAYVYWPKDAAEEAQARAETDRVPEASQPSGAPAAPSTIPEVAEEAAEIVSPTDDLRTSPDPLREVHAFQARLQELDEGPRARAMRASLDEVAVVARREGQGRMNDNPVEAWRQLSLAFFATTDERVREDLKPILDRLADELILGKRQVEGLSETVVVQAGDALAKIAKAKGTSWRLIARANGITDPRRIRVGDRLKVPNGIIELVVRKRAFTLFATYEGGYLRSYMVGTGLFDRTPETVFSISECIEEPTWYGPDGGIYPYGHEKNILGTRWLGFDRNEYSGFGIHGTRFPETIGTESSAGCIRMRNEDVEELYQLVMVGTRVSITK